MTPTEPPPTPAQRLLTAWVAFVCAHARAVLLLSLLATLAALAFSATTLGINTSTTQMLADDLPFRVNHEALKASFPQRKDNLVVVVDTIPAEITGYADVVLPECTYLERYDDLRNSAEREPSLALRVPANRIGAIVKGARAVSADTALRLARYFDTTAQFWLNLQTRHDLSVTERKSGADIARDVNPRRVA